jgi:hypothetical protein
MSLAETLQKEVELRANLSKWMSRSIETSCRVSDAAPCILLHILYILNKLEAIWLLTVVFGC